MELEELQSLVGRCGRFEIVPRDWKVAGGRRKGKELLNGGNPIQKILPVM